MSLISIDPWEEHCIECGEPECYKTCPKFETSRTGRCRRFDVFEKDGSWLTVGFRPWGKLELLWHGRLARGENSIGKRVRSEFEKCERLALWLGPWFYRIFRSFRWRALRMIAREKLAPNIWRIACRSERATELVASVAKPNGEEVLRQKIELQSGMLWEREIELPSMEEGMLVRISSYEGTDAPIVFERLELVREECQGLGVVKCVAWDLDDTVWSGTLVEDGISKLKLRSEVVETMHALEARGIVNSVVSKNDDDLALDALCAFGIEELIVFPQISWNAKSLAVQRLAEGMNIGIDAIVLVDDNAHEREEVTRVTGIDCVERLDELRALITRRNGDELIGKFGQFGVARRLAYREEMKRRKVQEKDFHDNAAAFLAQSELRFELLPVEGERLVRCRELVQRTNQLTLKARRYSVEDFVRLVVETNCRAVRVWDKYGDYGIVGFVSWNDKEIVELVFSCRVARKGVEKMVLDSLPKGLTINPVVTERNGPIREIVASWKETQR